MVRVQVEVPTDLSAEEKRTLKEYSQVSGGNASRGPLTKSFIEKMRRLFR
jgi:DnaJ-class molecular chaperone